MTSPVFGKVTKVNGMRGLMMEGIFDHQFAGNRHIRRQRLLLLEQQRIVGDPQILRDRRLRYGQLVGELLLKGLLPEIIAGLLDDDDHLEQRLLYARERALDAGDVFRDAVGRKFRSHLLLLNEIIVIKKDIGRFLAARISSVKIFCPLTMSTRS